MSSFSRGGCMNLPKDIQRLFTRLRSISHHQSSPFRNVHQIPQRSSLKTKAKGPPRTAPATNSVPLKQPRPLAHQEADPRSPGLRSAYAKTLARKETPTTLYSNLGDNTNTFALLAGGYCIGYGAMWAYDGGFVYHPGLWIGVGYMNLCGGLVIMGIGGSIWARLRGQVVKIQAVPVFKGQGLKLRVQKRNWFTVHRPEGRIVPKFSWNSTTSVDCFVHEMRMRETIMSIKKNWAGQTAAERLRELRDQGDTGARMIFAPIKNWFGKFTSMMLKILVGEGYANFRIEGEPQFRMDIKTGWLLDEGEALDRLLEEESRPPA